MRMSLRSLVIGSFVLLMLASASEGILAIVTSVTSAQQATALERSGLAPAVGLSILSQNLDQERALLAVDTAQLTPDQTRALDDDLTGLDASITGAAPHVLPAPTRARWRAAWAAYTRERAPFQRLLGVNRAPALTPATGSRISDRLDALLDLVQTQAGVQLNTGEKLYAQTLETDWRALRIVVISLLLTLAVGALLVYLITRRLGHGLGHLVATASQIAQGSVAVRADERGTDEIARLASAFNRMTDALLSA